VFKKNSQNHGGSIAENFVIEGARRKTNTTQIKVTKALSRLVKKNYYREMIAGFLLPMLLGNGRNLSRICSLIPAVFPVLLPSTVFPAPVEPEIKL
jgi:hypothetical protein